MSCGWQPFQGHSESFRELPETFLEPFRKRAGTCQKPFMVFVGTFRKHLRHLQDLIAASGWMYCDALFCVVSCRVCDAVFDFVVVSFWVVPPLCFASLHCVLFALRGFAFSSHHFVSCFRDFIPCRVTLFRFVFGSALFRIALGSHTFRLFYMVLFNCLIIYYLIQYTRKSPDLGPWACEITWNSPRSRNRWPFRANGRRPGGPGPSKHPTKN